MGNFLRQAYFSQISPMMECNGSMERKYRHILASSLCLVIWLSLTLPAASGVQNLILTDRQEIYDLWPYLALWEDPGKALSIEQAASAENRDEFISGKGKNANFGFSPSVYWARLTIENRATADTWVIMVYVAGYQWVDRIDLYVPGKDNGFDVYRDGEAIHPEQTMRPEIAAPAFRVKIPPGGTRTFYLRIEDEALTVLPLKILTEQSVKVKGRLYFFWLSLLGALGFFFLYNTLLYFTLRDTIFLFFGLVLLGIPLFHLMSELSHFVPALSIWWINRIKPQGQLYYLVAWLLLLRQYFCIDKSMPGLNRSIWFAVLYFMGLGLAAFVLPFYVWSLIKAWSTLLMCVGVLALSVAAWKKGLAVGRLSVCALMAVFFFAVLVKLDMLDIIAFPLWRTPEVRIFSLVGMLLVFSFALIDRYNVLSLRTLAAQQKAVAEMQQAEQAKDEFLANTSHELRTPLHGIIGICENLLERQAGNDAGSSPGELKVVLHSARRLSALMNDLLDFSHMKQGAVPLTLGPVEMTRAITTVVTLCRPMLGKKQLKLVTDLPEAPLRVWADAHRVQQILLNLVKNAIKFTDAGQIRISAHIAGDHLKVAVKDTGIGIPKEKLGQIFGRFQQLDSATDREYGGLGLGLAITKQLVEMQAGRIDVESRPGKGATFSFTLPLAGAGLAEGPAAEPLLIGYDDAQNLLPVPLAPVTAEVADNASAILIVDDEPISLYTLHSYLASAGYQVLTAPDALAAGEIIRHRALDLIILDIMMPRMDGYQLCRKVRLEYNPTELPVIMLTARTRTRDIVEGFRCGANDYVTKPVNRQELLARIRSALKLKDLTDLLRENEALKAQVIRRKRAEAELARTNRQLSQLLNLWEGGLVLADPRGRIIYINKGAQVLFGHEPHQIVTHTMDRLFVDPAPILEGFALSRDWPAPARGNADALHYQVRGIVAGSDAPLPLTVAVMPVTLEDDLVFALICQKASDPGRTSPHVAGELARSHQKMQAMQATFNSLKHHIDQQARHLTDELDTIEQTAVDIYAQQPGPEIEKLYRQAIVELVNAALTCWQETTGKSKVDLAEESRIWRAYLDKGTYKTRTLDKYLILDKLPKNPRVNDVLKTIAFVYRHSNPQHAAHKTLQSVHTRFMSLSKARKGCQKGVKN